MTDFKIGVVGVPGAWSTETLADAVQQHTGFRCIIDFNEVKLDINNNKACFHDHDLCSFDALIIKKITRVYTPSSVDRLIQLEWIKKQGVAIFSDPKSMSTLINRLGCTLSLSAANIPMPNTTITESPDQAISIIKQYKSCILKPLFSTKARGMCLINSDDEEVFEQVHSFHKDNPVMYIQQKIPLPGRDLGLMFLGGEYIATYARVSSSSSWNTTTQDGGSYACHTPHEMTIEIARKAQDCFNLTYTVVDMVEYEDPGQGLVFEVSAFGGFRGALEGCDINIAELYARHVIHKLEMDR